MNFCKRFFIFSVVLSFLLSPGISVAQAQEVNSNLCVPGDVFQTPSTGSFALDIGEQAQARAAMDWIYSMMEPLGIASNGGSIDFDRLYDFDYEGVVNGSYSLEVPSNFPAVSPSPLVVTSPVALPNSYRSIVTGTANGINTAGTHEVRAYLYTDAEYPQLVIPGVVDAGGNWSLDLSSISSAFVGSWRFRLYEITTDTQIGESWPRQEILENLEIGLYSVTDAEYLSFKQEVLPGGVFSFPNSFAGTKRVKLINNNGTVSDVDDVVLDTSTAGTGLVRSYELFPGDVGYGTSFQERTYSYDQALAVSSALSLGENIRAKDLVDGLLQLQHEGGSTDGAFYFSAPQLSPSSTDPILRTGAHSIVLYSLLHYIESNPADPDLASYINSANRALNYLDTLFVSSGPQEGLYLGGSGRYVLDVYEDYTIPWASTEHNLDTWHVFKKAGKILSDNTYQLKAKSLEEAMLEKLWNPITNRFYQGYGPTDPDTADALDTSSWGSMMLIGINDIEKAQSSIDRIGIYEYTDIETGVTGWGPYSDLGGYPGATPNVWYEGSFGVLMTYARNNLGSLYESTLDDLKQGQLSSGAFRYATETDSRYEIITSPSIASTAWYILGTVGRDSFWQECSYVAPVTEQNNSVSSQGGGSNVQYVCSDPEALNYERFGRSRNSLCEYEEGINVEEIQVSNNLEIPVEIINQLDSNTSSSINQIKPIQNINSLEDSVVNTVQDTESILIEETPFKINEGLINPVIPIENNDITNRPVQLERAIDDPIEEDDFDYSSEEIIIEEFPTIWAMIGNSIKAFFANIINLFI